MRTQAKNFSAYQSIQALSGRSGKLPRASRPPIHRMFAALNWSCTASNSFWQPSSVFRSDSDRERRGPARGSDDLPAASSSSRRRRQPPSARLPRERARDLAADARLPPVTTTTFLETRQAFQSSQNFGLDFSSTTDYAACRPPARSSRHVAGLSHLRPPSAYRLSRGAADHIARLSVMNVET